MQILTVAPIARGVLHGNLTYFAKEGAPIGSVVMVPIRTREVPALVVDVKEVLDTKSVLKTGGFAIRKISRLRPLTIWSEAFIESALRTSDLFACGLGEVLVALTPKTILDASVEGTVPEPSFSERARAERANIRAIQADTQTRIESYERLIRESFAGQKSIFICLPTELDVARVAGALARGIEEYTYELSSSTTKKKLLSAWEKIRTETHPIVVIGTPQYLTVPHQFDIVVLDEEHSRAWKTLMRPHIDMRTFVELYAKNSGSALILGAPILRPETHERIQKSEILEFGRLFTKARLNERVVPLTTNIIDLRAEEQAEKERTGLRAFNVFSKSVRELLVQTKENKESLLLLASRKGLSPITVCGDCGTTIKCPSCESPFVVHKRPDGTQIFSCHTCSMRRMPEGGDHEVCPNCKGWRLQGLGIGIERIEEILQEQFPDRHIFVFDGDRITTPAQARKCVAQFNTAKDQGLAPIMISTPMAIPYLESVDHTVIVSIDSLFAIPDIRMGERIFALVLALREKTLYSLTIQTRLEDHHLFELAVDGDLGQFTQEELVTRKQFSYPPYGTIIKITVHGKKDGLAQELKKLEEYLREYRPLAPNTISKKQTGLFAMHLIIKLPEGLWGDQTSTTFQDLLAKLRTLPREMSIEINPEHLL